MERTSHTKMASQARTQLLTNWRFHYPPPTYKTFPLSTSPPFTNLHRFIATRKDEITACKSFLRAQNSWINIHLPSMCQRCGIADETRDHAILQCTATDPHRTGPLLTINTTHQTRSSQLLTLILEAYILISKVGYLTKNIPQLATGSGTMSSLKTLSSAFFT